jgi:hypothetical protein
MAGAVVGLGEDVTRMHAAYEPAEHATDEAGRS